MPVSALRIYLHMVSLMGGRDSNKVQDKEILKRLCNIAINTDAFSHNDSSFLKKFP